MKKFDFLIVGAGFFGSTIARKLTDANKNCLIIDKQEHLAGAAYDKIINGVPISQYGAHILHSQSDDVWNFIKEFTEIENFINKPKVLTNDKVYSFPINLMTLHQLWGIKTPEEARKKLDEVRIPCTNPKNFEEWVLDKIGRELYELFIYGYTKKQWMKEPKDLPSSIIQRLPIRLNYDENYFATKHQGMPKNGFTKLIENMLTGIKVDLGVDFFSIKDKWQEYANHLIYTGPVDRFYDYVFGKLEYNTLRFEHKEYTGNFQGNAVFNYTDLSTPYLRSVEHKHFYIQNPKHDLKIDQEKTIVTYDYPIKFEDHPEPYYPIRDAINSNLYHKYMLLNTSQKITFGGRLGEYKYLDIDQSIASAIKKSQKFINT